MSSSWLTLDVKNLKLPSWLALGPRASVQGGLRVAYPPVAVEMAGTYLALVRLARTKAQRRWTLRAHTVEDLPPDSLEGDAWRAHLKAPDAVRAQVAGALAREGVKTRQISVVMPDHLARVALLPFEELPRTRREVLELVRWRMKKAVPFKVEEAALDYQVLPPFDGQGLALLAVLMPRSIVEQHEALFQDQGIRPGLVDLGSFSVVQLYRGVIEKEVSAAGDFLLLNATPSYLTVLIYRAGRLIFYRCKSFLPEAEETEAGGAPAWSMRREVQSSLIYYQEKLSGRTLDRVYLRLVGHDQVEVAQLLEGAPTASPPEMIDVGRVVDVGGRIAASGPDRAADLLQKLAPAVGAAMGREARTA